MKTLALLWNSCSHREVGEIILLSERRTVIVNYEVTCIVGTLPALVANHYCTSLNATTLLSIMDKIKEVSAHYRAESEY